MPYDKYDRWIPPKDGYDSETGYNWMDYDLHDEDFLDLIESGEWESIGISNLNDLANLYQTPEWSKLNNDQRVKVIGEFQNKYHGDDDTYFSWGQDDRASEEWGLDIRRISDEEGGMASDWDGAYKWFEEMGSSEIYPSDSTIDWASYNDDNLYDAARKSMVEKHPEIFGDNYMNKYDTIREVRTAQGIINKWSDQEREEALEWASKNVTPNKKDNDDVQEYFPTRKFNPATNTTTYYDHLTGAETGKKQWLPPDPPKPLTIIQGERPDDAPDNTYYNPQKYGTPESLTAKMKKAPPEISAPAITIRNIGEPKKPTRHYMALNDTVWTDPKVDKRSTRWSASEGREVETIHKRKDAEFPMFAPPLPIPQKDTSKLARKSVSIGDGGSS